MATKSLGLTGRDYSTLAAWASYVNALSLSADEILEVYNDGGAVADTASVTVGGWTANGFSVTIRPASGHGIKDNPNKLTNALRWDSSNGAALTNSIAASHAYVFGGANLIVQDLQFRATSASAVSCVAVATHAITINRSILWQSANTSGKGLTQSSGSVILNDCLIYSKGDGVLCNDFNAVRANNCTIAGAGNGKGIKQPYAAGPIIKNTSVIGFATDYEGASGTGSTNNATDKGTFGGTGFGTSGQTSIGASDFENLTAGTEDFRIKSGSTKLIDTGAASIGSGSDVVSTVRTGTRDIGAWEASSSGSAPSITSNPSNQSVSAGATATFTAAASGSPTPTYQWQRNPGGAGSWADISGAVAASYTTPATTVSGGSANNGDTYRCVATNTNGTATTTAATLTVSAANAAPTFPGPSVTDMTLGLGAAMSPVNVASKFSDTDALTFSAVGSWPPGLAVSSAGVISGTPTSAGAYTSLKVRATDTAAQTVDSNTFTITISASAGTLNFQATGMEFGRRSGLGVSTFGLDTASNYRYTVHADALTLGSAVYSSGVVATDSAGKLPNLTDASLVTGTTYRVHAIRQADGEAATFRMVAG